MLKRMVQLFFLIVGGALGIFFVPEIINMLPNGNELLWIQAPYISFLIGAFTVLSMTFWMIDHIVVFLQRVEEKLVKAPITDVLFGSLGLILGLIVAFLIVMPLKELLVTSVVSSFITILLGYLGFQVGFKKRNDLMNLFTLTKQGQTKNQPAAESDEKVKVLDASVIIDGRIEAICQTGFLEGTLVIPQFVLEEVQHVADSSDKSTRARGRKGLDILNKIQKEFAIKVEIYEDRFEGIEETDHKLTKLAKLLNGIVVTTDVNLQKICALQNIAVLNINELAQALKPVVLPGEGINVKVVKDGKGSDQAIAYLDDGTMIVVEEGRHFIGKNVEVLVTKILQNSAGRMIFAKPKLLKKAL